MLRNSQKRHEIIDKGLSRLSKLNFNRVFTEWRRDIELVQVAKAVQALASSKKSPSKPAELATINTSHDVNSGAGATTPATAITSAAPLINPIPMATASNT